MELEKLEIEFLDSNKSKVALEKGSVLSEKLDVNNSPILFGCRMGICGTCLIEVHAGEFPQPSATEAELLTIVAPENPKARLACQLELHSNCVIKRIQAK